MKKTKDIDEEMIKNERIGAIREHKPKNVIIIAPEIDLKNPCNLIPFLNTSNHPTIVAIENIKNNKLKKLRNSIIKGTL